MSQELFKSQEPDASAILSATGEPFKTAGAAQAAMAHKGLAAAAYEVLPVMDGFGIFARTQTQPASNPAAPEEKYYVVMFQQKSHPNDPDMVVLSVNGDQIQVHRGIEVTLPERFLECADHTTFPHYEQVPGEPRKITSYIRLFPYQRIREGRAEDYFDRRRAGTDQLRKELEIQVV